MSPRLQEQGHQPRRVHLLLQTPHASTHRARPVLPAAECKCSVRVLTPLPMYVRYGEPVLSSPPPMYVRHGGPVLFSHVHNMECLSSAGDGGDSAGNAVQREEVPSPEGECDRHPDLP